MLLKRFRDCPSEAKRLFAILNLSRSEKCHAHLLLEVATDLSRAGRHADASLTIAPIENRLDALTARQSLVWCQIQYTLGNYGPALVQMDLRQHEITEVVHALRARLLIGLGRLSEARALITSSPHLSSSPAATFELIGMLVATLNGQPPSYDQLQQSISGKILTEGNKELLLLLLAEARMADQALKLMDQMPDTPFCRVNRAHVLHLAGRPADADKARLSALEDAMAWNCEADNGVSWPDLLASYIASGYCILVSPSHPWIQLSSLRWANPESRTVLPKWNLCGPFGENRQAEASI
ncbi:MAG: hypothetical protein WCN95_03230 [bacterium]